MWCVPAASLYNISREQSRIRLVGKGNSGAGEKEKRFKTIRHNAPHLTTISELSFLNDTPWQRNMMCSVLFQHRYTAWKSKSCDRAPLEMIAVIWHRRLHIYLGTENTRGCGMLWAVSCHKAWLQEERLESWWRGELQLQTVGVGACLAMLAMLWSKSCGDGEALIASVERRRSVDQKVWTTSLLLPLLGMSS